jgi:gamma-glutamyl hydrolase
MRSLLFLSSAVLLLTGSASKSRDLPPQVNDAPTIGILSVPVAQASPCQTRSILAGSLSCFTTFYMKWVESAGARAVIIPVDADEATVHALLDSVNGVLFTGGGLENLTFSSPYMVQAKRIYDVVLAKNTNGTYFPLHGTCQGFQVLSLLTSQNSSVMSYYAFDSEDLSLALDISWDGHHASRIFNVETAPADIVDTLGNKPVTSNLHHDGVAVADFANNAALSSFYILVSTNFDRKGKAFVSTIEAWEYPVTGTQWHPERNQFEWRPSTNMNHSPDAIEAMLYMAKYFVGNARRNSQSFADNALFQRYSVFSYPIVSDVDAATSGYQWLVYSD